MADVRCDLLVRLDEDSQRFVFCLSKKQGQYSPATAEFSVEIDFDELKARGPDGAEKLIGDR